MTCSSFVSLVADYVAGDLPDAAECEIVAHVRECTACAAVLERERSVRSIRTLRSDEKTEHSLSARLSTAPMLSESSAWVGCHRPSRR